ncbi:MAG: hypothetical protein P4L96_15945 [Rhodoferax sp.]|nr:hypothetical protein [Rhodoferax sp.]
MKAKRRCIPNFEARSVMIIAAWALGSAAAVHAQTPYSPPPRRGAPMTTPSDPPRAGASHDDFISRAESDKTMK